MNRRSTKTSDDHAPYGLSLSGTVIDRTRRMVPRDNPTIEIVTYTIQDGANRKFFVDGLQFLRDAILNIFIRHG